MDESEERQHTTSIFDDWIHSAWLHLFRWEPMSDDAVIERSTQFIAAALAIYSDYGERAVLDCREALRVIRDCGEGTADNVQALADRTGYPPHVAEAWIRLLCDSDVCEYGSSPRYCFLTDRGLELLALLEDWPGNMVGRMQRPKDVEEQVRREAEKLMGPRRTWPWSGGYGPTPQPTT